MPRVLVVEDSPTQARQVQYILEDAGFKVSLAADGLEALKAVRGDAPDVVVTDMEMPNMNGLALVEAIRQDYPFVPVILITSRGSEAIAARALRAGAASYVRKHDLALDLIPTLEGVLAVVQEEADRRSVLGYLTRSESDFVLANDPAVIVSLVRHFEEGLAAMRLCDPTELTRVGIALREALVNAIEQGNLELASALRREDPQAYRQLLERRRDQSPYRERRVYVTARASRAEAVYVVRDEGPGFAPTTSPALTDPAGTGRSASRGLLLIRTLMDDVSHDATGREITLVKRASRRASR